jgi:predicted small lipoprotein YifL
MASPNNNSGTPAGGKKYLYFPLDKKGQEQQQQQQSQGNRELPRDILDKLL